MQASKRKKKSVSEQAREKRGRRKVKDFEMFEQLISWSQATKLSNPQDEEKRI